MSGRRARNQLHDERVGNQRLRQGGGSHHDQQTKLQAIIDVLNSVNATLETKLAAIEAAMKAQTLNLESKLDLLEKGYQGIA